MFSIQVLKVVVRKPPTQILAELRIPEATIRVFLVVSTWLAMIMPVQPDGL
jgi:hypothetical protein